VQRASSFFQTVAPLRADPDARGSSSFPSLRGWLPAHE
jgi:hypothetical protein